MTNDAIGRLIENSAHLRYLSVRKCYGLNLKTLDLKMRKSPSDLLKINTYLGVIVWNGMKKECRLFRNDWTSWDASVEMQERAYTMSMGGSASPWGSKKVEIRRPNPQEFYGPCGGLFMCEGSFFDIHEMQEEEGDNFSLERAFQKQWLKSSPLYRKMNGKW